MNGCFKAVRTAGFIKPTAMPVEGGAMSDFFTEYEKHVKERAALGISPLALTEEQCSEVVSMLQAPPSGKGEELLYLIKERVTPGVDPAAGVKAGFLADLAEGKLSSPLITPSEAVSLLGTMVGGYNVEKLTDLLETPLAGEAADQLENAVLAVNSFERIAGLAESGNTAAERVVASWAGAEWFTRKNEIPAEMKAVVYKVDGEINTDDFSPASQAFTRADIPLHSTCMGGVLFPDGPAEIAALKEKHGLPVCLVGDVVGTGSSRKSACNSLIWHIGNDIPFVPNKREGGLILGGVIAPIFFNTAEDSGALPVQADVTGLKTGMIISVKPLEGRVEDSDGNLITEFRLQPATILDEFRAGGRVPLIIGKQLTGKARVFLGLSNLEESGIFTNAPVPSAKPDQGYTLAQKIVGRACGTEGVLPGTSCLPKMTTVGSQDTTGPMTAGEMTELACLEFNADLVMQSFCHTAAYPKPADIITHGTLPGFISSRKGIALRPGDGVIHSWLNRLLVPDTVGTGGDSHTRFPLGISFPAGSGLVAFAAALGVMPLDMPESVLVRFSGTLQPGITLRDAVNFIPWKAIDLGLLTVEKKNKKNVFSGRILEIEGLPDLTVEQAFELTDASAERSAAAATIRLDRKSVDEYLKSNVALMEAMIEAGFEDSETLRRRIGEVQEWLEKGELFTADVNADYAAVIEIDLNELAEPILACPNDPDDVKKLSEVSGASIDDVFIGSCMTNIGHFRAAAEVLAGEPSASRLWLCPPTVMDSDQLKKEGYFARFAASGARIEIPGCSLCMGNQARVPDGAVVFSTSTRNFNNRMGKDTLVYLGSAELGAVCAKLGRIPSQEEYRTMAVGKLEGKSPEIYRYMNFHLEKDFSIK